MRGALRWTRMVAIAVVIGGFGANVVTGVAESTPTATPGERNLAADDVMFFVDPAAPGTRQAREWADSRPDDAALMERLGQQPQADWFGDWTADPRGEIGDRLTQIVDAGALPVLVFYTIPYRDCGLYSAGGANDPETYRTWITEAAAGIGDRPAVVILEPDAVAGTDCLNAEQEAERFALLSFAVETLEAKPLVDVYVDAGNATWHPAAETARRLQLAGIDKATGFSLNVSNFHTTDVTTAYGRGVSDALGASNGTPFVIDTSRNGNGPWEEGGAEAWCNPPDRALGAPATVETADPLVDAYLWIKRPGESDGECRDAPPAGQWYPEYALELARNAEW